MGKFSGSLWRLERDLPLWRGGEAGGIDYATVSAATARWKKRVATDRQLRKVQNRALQILNAKGRVAQIGLREK